MHLTSERLGAFFGRDADCFARFQINKCSCDLSPVAKLQGALAKAASSDDGNRVGHAAIDLDVGNQAFAILAAGIVNAQQFEPQHGHAHTEDLSGAQVSVGFVGIAQEFVE
jgi:hypothetical protein